MLIVLEGLDACGKHTQAMKLSERLTNEGIQNKTISFPDYGSDSSKPVSMFLKGEINDDNPYAISTLYAMDRYISYITKWKQYCKNNVIIADRYTTSNIVHQMPKLPINEQTDYIFWLYDTEYTLYGLPEPDIIIYLSQDISTTEKLLNKRYNGDTNKRDMNERNIEYLKNCKDTIERYIKGTDTDSELKWSVVYNDVYDEATGEYILRNPNEITDEIFNIVYEKSAMFQMKIFIDNYNNRNKTQYKLYDASKCGLYDLVNLLPDEKPKNKRPLEFNIDEITNEYFDEFDD